MQYTPYLLLSDPRTKAKACLDLVQLQVIGRDVQWRKEVGLCLPMSDALPT